MGSYSWDLAAWEWFLLVGILYTIFILPFFGIPVVLVGLWAKSKGRNPHWMWFPVFLSWLGVAIPYLWAVAERISGPWKVVPLVLLGVIAAIFAGVLLLVVNAEFGGLYSATFLLLSYTLPVVLFGLAAMSRGRSPHYMWFPAAIPFLGWVVAIVVLVVIFSRSNEAKA